MTQACCVQGVSAPYGRHSRSQRAARHATLPRNYMLEGRLTCAARCGGRAENRGKRGLRQSAAPAVWRAYGKPSCAFSVHLRVILVAKAASRLLEEVKSLKSSREAPIPSNAKALEAEKPDLRPAFSKSGRKSRFSALGGAEMEGDGGLVGRGRGNGKGTATQQARSPPPRSASG